MVTTNVQRWRVLAIYYVCSVCSAGCLRHGIIDTSADLPPLGAAQSDTGTLASLYLPEAHADRTRSVSKIVFTEFAGGGIDNATCFGVRYALLRGYQDRGDGRPYYLEPQDSYVVAGGGSFDIGASVDAEGAQLTAVAKVPLATRDSYHILNGVALEPRVTYESGSQGSSAAYGGSLVLQFNRGLFMPLVITPYFSWQNTESSAEDSEETRSVGFRSLVLDGSNHGIAALGCERQWRRYASSDQTDGVRALGRLYFPGSGYWCGITYEEFPAATSLQFGTHRAEGVPRDAQLDWWAAVGVTDGFLEASLHLAWVL